MARKLVLWKYSKVPISWPSKGKGHEQLTAIVESGIGTNSKSSNNHTPTELFDRFLDEVYAIDNVS